MKKLLFFGFVLFQTVFMVQGQIVLQNDKQAEGLQTLSKEKIFVHYNTSFLLTGEYFYYKIYGLNAETNLLSDLSKVAYLELVGKSGDLVFRHKVRLENGQGYGDFFIPTTISSGSYKVLAYTRWMLNDHISTFFQGDITIVNPYQEDQTSLQSVLPSAVDSLQEISGSSRKFSSENRSKTRVESMPIKFSMNKERLKKREIVSLLLTAEENGLLNGSYSISVRRKGGVAAPEQLSSSDFIDVKREEVSNLTDIIDEIYLPELRGELFAGTVEALKSGAFVKNLNVAISIPGESYYFNVITTDANGNFYFNVDSSYSGEKLIFQVLGKNPMDYKISMKELTLSGYSELDFNTVFLEPSMKKEILQRSVHNQIENSYFQFRPDSLITTVTKQIFDNKEKAVYVLDDYTRFETLRETVLEIIDDVSSEKLDKTNSVLKVKGFDYATSGTLLPLVMVDGCLIQDHNALLDSDAGIIEEITVLRHKFIFGPEVFQGVLLLKTQEENKYENFLSYSNTKAFTVFKPQSYKRYFVQRYKGDENASHLPDDRLQLMWDPNLELIGKEKTLDFFTSDVLGEFEIQIEGFTDDNRPVSIRKSIYVD